jgi:hypothetical protein
VGFPGPVILCPEKVYDDCGCVCVTPPFGISLFLPFGGGGPPVTVKVHFAGVGSSCPCWFMALRYIVCLPKLRPVIVCGDATGI